MTFYPFFVKGENVTEDLDKLGKMTVLYRSWRIANFWNEFELHGRGAVKSGFLGKERSNSTENHTHRTLTSLEEHTRVPSSAIAIFDKEGFLWNEC